MITQSKLKEVLHYNKDTGIFTWVKSGRGIPKSKQAGTTHPSGYIIIRINRKDYLAHRLTWLYINGEWPQNNIDHLNGIKDDNRIENLRNCTQLQNMQNLEIHRSGKLVGASFFKHANRWASQIQIKGKRIHIGYYKTEFEAHEAYIAMEWIFSEVEKL